MYWAAAGKISQQRKDSFDIDALANLPLTHITKDYIKQ